jgi:predicted phage terminase large subunit-like protein
MAENLNSILVSDEQIDIRMSRQMFWDFCMYYDREFFEKRPFLKQIADGLQQIAKGEIQTLSASLPPRSGKSYLTSLFCAWWLALNPEKSIMRNCCTSYLFRKFSYDVRNIIKDRKFQKVFPAVKLQPDKQNVDGWNLTTAKQVSYFGAGVGGSIIGFGANIAISDDLYRGIDDALSSNYNEAVIRWKESSHDSRKEKDCPEIFVGTRWSKRDVIGRAIENGKIDKPISVSALINNQSFCEDVKSTAEYLEIRDSIDETIWQAEYMQEPIENKGLLFPSSELKFYDPEKLDLEKVEFAYMHIDPADDGSDSYATPLCLLVGDRIYVHDVIYSTDGSEITEPETVLMAQKYKLNYAEFEGNSGWVIMGKNLRREFGEKLPYCGFRIIKNTTNKETRILAASAFVKYKMYFRSDYKSLRQYNNFMLNITGYLREGGNKHDDGADSIAGAAKYFQIHFKDIF